MLEIVPLPEIVPLEETPHDVVGVFDLRGRIVPVIDLNLRFGHPPQRCRLEDCIIVLERAGSAIGILVNEVQNVRDVAPGQRSPVPLYETEPPSELPFLMGLVKSGEQVVMLLHLENLLSLAQSLKASSDVGGSVEHALSDVFCPDAAPDERAVFRERARSLARPLESQEQSGLLSVAVVRLGEEFFGIELQAIREFTELHSVTPVPCCPAHVVGQMNLRGDLITIIDIAETLGLPAAQERARRNVVVVNSADLGAGVLVDALLDVLYLPPADVMPARTDGQTYLRGTATYGSHMLTLLDLLGLLMQDTLQVNEKP